MNRVTSILQNIKANPAKKPKPNTLANFLAKQEREGIEKKKKMFLKKMKKNQNKQQSPVKQASVKKIGKVVTNLTKAQKYLHHKVYGCKKKTYISPKCAKSSASKSPKSANSSASKSPKSAKSSASKSPKSAKSAVSNYAD